MSATARTIADSSTGVEPHTDLIREALDRVEAGEAVSAIDAETLLSARDQELDRLLRIAGRVRDRGLEVAGRSGVITYSRKVFVPLTRLCQDRCHYCTFVQTPGQLLKSGETPYLSPEEILNVARDGAALGCKEVLFTLGDRPENRWPVAREWLDSHGYESTLEYMRHMAILILEETGLLAHLNPGVMTWAEMQRLKPVAPSMGMMLETTATRLWSEKGGPHYGSPDKDPAVRLRVLEDAGRSNIPFTTGVLLGIGENNAERVDAMFAIRDSSDRHGHIQEVIVQNFRAKPATAMMRANDLATQEYVAAVAVTRLVLGAGSRIQAPPNLTDAAELSLLIRAGIDDWGGVSPLTPDHVNPERPWPQIDELARLTAESGFELRERLTAHPHYIRAGEPWIDPRVAPHLLALADPHTGMAREDAPLVGRPWTAELPVPGRSPRGEGSVAVVLRAAETTPTGLSDDDYVTLLGATGADLTVLTAIADALRQDTVGDAVTYVVNRNVDSSLFPARLSAETLDELVDEATLLGATELCIQGAIDPALPGATYLDLVRRISTRNPNLHLHALRPVEILDGASRCGLAPAEFLHALREAGLGSVPGTGAWILDDGIRHTLSGGKDLTVAVWTSLITAAHRTGLRSTATMVYGHIESPSQQVAHLRALIRIQNETNGFTEFIPMPFVPAGFPAALGAIGGSGPTIDQTRALHAVARLMLSGSIDHIQAAWPKLGIRASQQVLQGGADDLGGVLLDGTLSPGAGQEAGLVLAVRQMERSAAEIGRSTRQRTTLYGSV
ncbi:7,8-didemethyl-8-hydroxy-5-deazariboflavin synthase CofG [Cryobacterium sp. CG_9.6]|uniref:7,8-didemethyl-8-hydroxy-5-deazariboflavin synthase CofG n=1 Tax=Cryobacterium sp. CG_9.6 TaxID=2760710 RepID=UPI002474C3E3|nr:7,8-didemethyl-8-hydroxy-5-deazariboflavin synthase CofG [Cryobacterium sp. CG_9.6]MDH6235268.1 FO synthase [Cryobacterium sp. CG_9.6]